MIGVYAFIQKSGKHPSYIGYSTNVERRIKEHFAIRRSFTFDSWIIWQEFETRSMAHREEQRLIQNYEPMHNSINKEKRHFDLHQCERIEEVLEGYEHPPWKPMSMIDRVYYKSARQKWIDQGRQI